MSLGSFAAPIAHTCGHFTYCVRVAGAASATQAPHWLRGRAPAAQPPQPPPPSPQPEADPVDLAASFRATRHAVRRVALAREPLVAFLAAFLPASCCFAQDSIQNMLICSFSYVYSETNE